MSRRYSEEQHAWLRAYIPGHHHAETAKAFTEKWPDTQMTANMVKAYSNNHHIPCGRKFDGHPYKFPKEVRDFISENVKGRSEEELLQMITNKFGSVMSARQLHTYKKNHDIHSGLTGRFEKGHIPANKGKTWSEYMSKEGQEHSRKTCYAAGNVPHSHLPIGTVVKAANGYLTRKIGEPNKWEFVHRATWEKYNGPIPDGMLVSFKDGNAENCDISNLMLITRAENARLNNLHLRYAEPELAETGLLIAKVLTAAEERKHKRKKTNGKGVSNGSSYERKDGLRHYPGCGRENLQ